MKKYIRVLLIVASMSQSSAAIYRIDYFLRIIRAFLDVLVSYVIISAIFLHAPLIAGWTRWEALVVYGVFQLIQTSVYMFTGYGINMLGKDIIHGRIDRFLMQPIDSQFFASIRITFITNFFRFLFAFFILGLAIINVSTYPTLAQLTLTTINIISGAIIYYCLNFSMATTSFWTFSSEMWEFVQTITSVARFPTDIFGKSFQKMMYVIPLAFIATVPAKVLLGKIDYLSFISPLIAFGAIVFTRKLWLLGLKSYQSVSS